MADKAPPPPTPTEPEIIRPIKAMTVLCYHATSPEGLDQHFAGVVTGTYDNPKLCDITTFHTRGSQFPAAHPVQGACFCLTDADLEKAAGGGNKWLCKPADPTSPEPYVKPPAKEPKKRN